MNSLNLNRILFSRPLVLCLLFFCSCASNKKKEAVNNKKENAMNYDSELMTPDSHGGGNILTPLGCLVYGPWQIRNPRGYNVAIYFNDKQISSFAQEYTEIEKQLVFELQKNGSLKYWFKKDYEQNPVLEDSSYEKEGISRVTHYRPGVDKIKKLYTKGSWKANFNDSTVVIEFGDDNLPPLNGRYSLLGSDNLNIQRTFVFDSTYNGEKVKLKKVLTTYYDHPWINF